ncbi:Homeobox protein EgHBX4 [Pleurostoma richardsiae]|uniref:Homeobox protein EgHBX4 n=1 Tax=Pleurostoma richardsiae TaxID=41990 RepID=A0AA38S259_9PEZI|nr:Homeobox protein EgHBX4 [Pleurostoma richardsiae]
MGDQPQAYYALRTRRPADGASLSSADSTYGSAAGGVCTPAATHDTSRVSYHVKQLDTFAQTLQESASRAFPNRGRSSQRYQKVVALLLHWKTDDLFVLPELEDLEKCLREDYGFETDVFPIPSENAHLELMLKVGAMIKDHESEDTLFVVYYGGHARIDESRQSTWCATRHSGSPWLQWSAIQTLLERSVSDTLILLDCCAGAASATFPTGRSITETISASSWDAIAPDPGRYSFTNALIEVLQEWRLRIFSAAMLHAEVLARLKHPRPILINGKHFEARSTPVHFMMTSNHKAPSIELCRFSANDTRTPSPSEDTTPSEPLSSGRSTLEEGASEPNEDEPHVMISLALEDDQRLDLQAWEQWLSSFPALAKYVKVQGVFKSHSTLLLLSLPVMVWDLLPDDQACSFVAFIRSNNLLNTRGSSETLISRAETSTVQEQVEEDFFEEEPIRTDTESFFSGTTYTPTDTASTIRPMQTAIRRAESALHRSHSDVASDGLGLGIRNLPVRSGTSAGVRTGFRRVPTGGYNPPDRAGNIATRPRLSQASASVQSMRRTGPAAPSWFSPPGGSDSNGEPLQEEGNVRMPILNQARSSRRTTFYSDRDIPDGPPLATHVVNRLEDYFANNPNPSIATTEYYASHLGVETSDIDLWFHHRRQRERMNYNLQNLKIDDNPPEANDGPRMILPGHLSSLLEILATGQVLLIDLRSPTDFQRSHIHTAVNLRAPASFLGAATLDMVERAFADEQSRRAFSRWRKAQCVVFYDRAVELPWECPAAAALLAGLRREGWRGECLVLKGHYREFADSFDKFVTGTRMTQAAKDYVDGLRHRPAPTTDEKTETRRRYEEWLDRLRGEERMRPPNLDASSLEERKRAVEEHQAELEEEFQSQFPGLYKKMLSLQPPGAAGGMDDENDFARKAPLVEPLSRGLEKMQEASAGGRFPGSLAGYSFPEEKGAAAGKLEGRSSEDFDEIDPKAPQLRNDPAFQRAGAAAKLADEATSAAGDKKRSRERPFWKRLRTGGM